MKIARLLIAITGFLLIAPLTLAQDEEKPSLRTAINKKRIFIGDRIRYRVELVSRRNLEIEFPKFKDSKIGDCEIKDAGSSVKKTLFGKKTYVNWLDITSYYVGQRAVPPIEIKYREKGEGNWKQLKTDELSFKVESVLPAGVRLKDIKDIKPPLYPFSLLKFIIFAVSGIIALWIFFKVIIWLFFKPAPPKLPHELALEELEAAKAGYSTGGDIKEYYVRISDAVRRYIETVFVLRAPEMTTQEFLDSLSKSPKLSGEYKDLLKIFMEACDLVKFAKYKPDRAGIESVFETAKNFILETKDKDVHI